MPIRHTCLKEMRDDVLIAGYFGHLIDRMQITPDESGHRAVNLDPVLRSEHRGFRPVDIQIGPDGAIYMSRTGTTRLSAIIKLRFVTPIAIKTTVASGGSRPKTVRWPKIPDFMAMDAAGLCRELASPVRFHREAGQAVAQRVERQIKFVHRASNVDRIARRERSGLRASSL